MHRYCAVAALLLLCLFQLSLTSVSAYKYGDPVSMLKRSQYKGFRTEWTEVIASEAPKFGVMKMVQLNPLTDARDYTTSDEFKMSFSFSGDRLLVPWVTITDGKAHFLKSIDFKFQYSQGYINHVRWHATYYDDVTTKPDHSVFRYHWEEILESDPALGINFLLVISTVVGWILAILILLEYDRDFVFVMPSSGNTPTSTANAVQMTVPSAASVSRTNAASASSSWTAPTDESHKSI